MRRRLESEVLLALKSKSTQELIWLLHLESSEEFVNAEISNDYIAVQSGGYPLDGNGGSQYRLHGYSKWNHLNYVTMACTRSPRRRF